MLRTLRCGLSLIVLATFADFTAAAQTVPSTTDGSTLKQIIIFGRHGVRSAALPDAALAPYASRPYPNFGVPTGYLTEHGYQAQFLLGSYFHDYLMNQGLLTGQIKVDQRRSYFRANSIQRSNISAAALGAALLPGVTTPVHSFPLGTPDALFDPLSAKVITNVDTGRAIRELRGIYGDGASIQSSYAGEYGLIRSILFNYPEGMQPAPPTPAGLTDPTAAPIPLTANTALAVSNVINIGSVFTTLYASDPFVMEYADGLPMDQVAWGQLTPEKLSQQTRMITLAFNLEVTSPYLAELQSSNAAVAHSEDDGAGGGERYDRGRIWRR